MMTCLSPSLSPFSLSRATDVETEGVGMQAVANPQSKI